MERNTEIKIEIFIAMKVAIALIDAGYKLGVNDGEETTVKNSTNLKEIQNALFTTDEDYLLVYKDGKKIGWVFLIWGNVEHVVSDYTVNLEHVLDPMDFENIVEELIESALEKI